MELKIKDDQLEKLIEVYCKEFEDYDGKAKIVCRKEKYLTETYIEVEAILTTKVNIDGVDYDSEITLDQNQINEIITKVLEDNGYVVKNVYLNYREKYDYYTDAPNGYEFDYAGITANILQRRRGEQ